MVRTWAHPSDPCAVTLPHSDCLVIGHVIIYIRKTKIIDKTIRINNEFINIIQFGVFWGCGFLHVQTQRAEKYNF